MRRTSTKLQLKHRNTKKKIEVGRRKQIQQADALRALARVHHKEGYSLERVW